MVTALIVAAALTAAATIGVGIYSAHAQKQSVEDTNALTEKIHEEDNAFNAEQAEIQRDYETSMSNTAIQRRVEDLKAAGLNPALAVTSGSASTPGAVAASSGGSVPMKAVDYSPLSQMSANLGHLVNSAARIQQLNELTKRDPHSMAQLAAMSKGLMKSTMSAGKMDSLKSLYEQGVIDTYRKYYGSM